MKLVQNMRKLRTSIDVVALFDAILNSQLLVVDFKYCAPGYHFWYSKESNDMRTTTFYNIPYLLNRTFSIGKCKKKGEI